MTDTKLILTIIGSSLIIAGLLSLIYQFFSSSTLTVLGVICMNLAWSWFNWNWMLWFAFLWLIAISCGFIITATGAQQALQKNTWMPVLGALLGAIFIPIPFLGALIGVFIGAIIGLFTIEPKLNKQKVDLALEITFKSFLGLVIEVTAVIEMIISLLLLALF